MVRGWKGPTVLVTAAPSVYADVIGSLAGFTSVQGSGYSDDGYVENVHEHKVRRLQPVLENGLDCGISDDVVLDGPLLALAATAFVVGPRGELSEYHSVRSGSKHSAATVEQPLGPSTNP
jgi:phosphoserine phosphatase